MEKKEKYTSWQLFASKGIARKDFIQLFLSLVAIMMLNFIGSFFFARYDLTSEKKYTLSPATKEMLGKLDDVVYFKIYLDGNLPADFIHLKTSVKEMLDEFRVYSKGNIEYQFVNPMEESDKKKQNDVIRQLMEKGLMPTQLEIKAEGGTSQQTVFPGALATYHSREFPVQFFKEQFGVPSDMQLNNSIQSLEYELSTTIRKLTMKEKSGVAFTEGHGELDSIQVADIAHALGDYYATSRLRLDDKLTDATELFKKKAVVIAKPETPFSEQTKFLLDQYVMQGGKILWLVDGVFASMDSLTRAGETYAVALPLNIENQLFKYGVRINPDVVMDSRCGVVPFPVNNKYQLMPWYYFPLLSQSNNHPIVNNINLVRGEFVSTLDTITTTGIKKTLLLSTSRYTRAQNAPVQISLRSMFMQPDPLFFNQSYKTVALLLEGKFESLYKNHPLPALHLRAQPKFKEESVPTKMIVVAGGDIIRNAVQHSTNRAYPLGYDVYSRQTYGNKNFILNAVNYLCDDSGLLQVRSRELKLRMMDRNKIMEEKAKWKGINMIIPILLIVAYGIMQVVIRRRKFAV